LKVRDAPGFGGEGRGQKEYTRDQFVET
jgi:hypothetical protein